jgi:hypothetical protein
MALGANYRAIPVPDVPDAASERLLDSLADPLCILSARRRRAALMMSGTPTIGTWDGATIEMVQETGAENRPVE